MVENWNTTKEYDCPRIEGKNSGHGAAHGAGSGQEFFIFDLAAPAGPESIKIACPGLNLGSPPTLGMGHGGSFAKTSSDDFAKPPYFFFRKISLKIRKNTAKINNNFCFIFRI